MKKFLDAAHAAAGDTARFMTGQLRHHALNHGWDADVVANTHVVFEDNKFSTHIHPDYVDRAFVHEFGNESNRPTAVIRKFLNNDATSKQAFMISMNNHWKKA